MTQQQKLILPQQPAEQAIKQIKEDQPKHVKPTPFLDKLHRLGFILAGINSNQPREYRARERQALHKKYVDEYGNVQELERNQHFSVEEHFTDDEKLVKVVLVSRARYERFRYFRDSFYAEPGKVASQLEKAKRGVVAQLREDDALRAETAKALRLTF